MYGGLYLSPSKQPCLSDLVGARAVQRSLCEEPGFAQQGTPRQIEDLFWEALLRKHDTYTYGHTQLLHASVYRCTIEKPQHGRRKTTSQCCLLELCDIIVHYCIFYDIILHGTIIDFIILSLYYIVLYYIMGSDDDAGKSVRAPQ